MTVAMPAAPNQAPTRLSSAVSNVLALVGWLRLKPTTKAWAGRATTSRNATTKLTLSVPNRDQTKGIRVPAKAPASAALTGVGSSFTLPCSCVLPMESLGVYALLP